MRLRPLALHTGGTSEGRDAAAALARSAPVIDTTRYTLLNEIASNLDRSKHAA
jgi:hypothetical protein